MVYNSYFLDYHWKNIDIVLIYSLLIRSVRFAPVLPHKDSKSLDVTDRNAHKHIANEPKMLANMLQNMLFLIKNCANIFVSKFENILANMFCLPNDVYINLAKITLTAATAMDKDSGLRINFTLKNIGLAREFSINPKITLCDSYRTQIIMIIV